MLTSQNLYVRRARGATRWVVGLVFIFSGLIKANDPLGLSYKMQEFFEAWHLHGFETYTLPLSLCMNVFEVVAGVAILVAWQMRLFSWLLLLLIIFFAFLTGYAVLHPEQIKTCGCFGDCLPLTPTQSFFKDLGLLILILLIFLERKKIVSALRPGVARAILFCSFAMVCIFQWYVLTYLPVIDCLPYKKGNNLASELARDKAARPDSFAITFQYRKNGKTVAFDQDHLPVGMDSSYEFVGRYDRLVKGGENRTSISDFNLATAGGIDTTQAVLAGNRQVWIMVRHIEPGASWLKQADQIISAAHKNGWKVLIITSVPEEAGKRFLGSTTLTSDATVMKTAARANPVYLLVDKGTILEKVSNPDYRKVLDFFPKTIIR